MRKLNRLSALSLILMLAGCQTAGPGLPGTAPSGSSGTAPVTCNMTCNSEYDSCMDRFSGAVGGGGLPQRSEDSTGNLGPNDVCPDQLKSCLRRCLN
jgi:hypothetical protein